LTLALASVCFAAEGVLAADMDTPRDWIVLKPVSNFSIRAPLGTKARITEYGVEGQASGVIEGKNFKIDFAEVSWLAPPEKPFRNKNRAFEITSINGHKAWLVEVSNSKTCKGVELLMDIYEKELPPNAIGGYPNALMMNFCATDSQTEAIMRSMLKTVRFSSDRKV
jgi:hypothetical protein